MTVDTLCTKGHRWIQRCQGGIHLQLLQVVGVGGNGRQPLNKKKMNQSGRSNTIVAREIVVLRHVATKPAVTPMSLVGKCLSQKLDTGPRGFHHTDWNIAA